MATLLQKLLGVDKERGIIFSFLVSEAKPIDPESVRIKLISILPRYYDQIHIEFEYDSQMLPHTIKVSCSHPTSRFKGEGKWKIFYDLYNLYVPNCLRYLEGVGVRAICSVEHLKNQKDSLNNSK